MNRNWMDKIERTGALLNCCLTNRDAEYIAHPTFSSYVRAIDLFRPSCTSVWRLGITASRRSVFYTRVSRRQHAAPAAMHLRPAYYAAWLERQGLEHARCDVINYLREREERDQTDPRPTKDALSQMSKCAMQILCVNNILLKLLILFFFYLLS